MRHLLATAALIAALGTGNVSRPITLSATTETTPTETR